MRHWPFMRLSPLVVASLAAVPLAIPQAPGPIPARETLNYTIEWRLITAGKARVDWSAQPRSGWDIKLHLESVGLVSKLFKVEDDYNATLNQALCVQSSQLTTHEGSRQRETRIAFDAEAKRANYLERDRAKNSVLLAQETPIPPCVHDVIGGLYFLRT